MHSLQKALFINLSFLQKRDRFVRDRFNFWLSVTLLFFPLLFVSCANSDADAVGEDVLFAL